MKKNQKNILVGVAVILGLFLIAFYGRSLSFGIGLDRFSEGIVTQLSGSGESSVLRSSFKLDYYGSGATETINSGDKTFINLGEGFATSRIPLDSSLYKDVYFNADIKDFNIRVQFNANSPNESFGTLSPVSSDVKCKLVSGRTYTDWTDQNNPKMITGTGTRCYANLEYECKGENINTCGFILGNGYNIAIDSEFLKEDIQCTQTQKSLCSSDEICSNNVCIKSSVTSQDSSESEVNSDTVQGNVQDSQTQESENQPIQMVSSNYLLIAIVLIIIIITVLIVYSKVK